MFHNFWFYNAKVQAKSPSDKIVAAISNAFTATYAAVAATATFAAT